MSPSLCAQTIADFNSDSDLSAWRITDDVVMGGHSAGHFAINEQGHGYFYGRVSLENNGGFSSVQHYFDALPAQDGAQLVMRIKGDGKDYQLRVKAEQEERFWYVAPFKTTGDWQEIRIPLANMHPQYHGRPVDRPAFDRAQISAVALLIANGKAQDFSLLIDWLRLEQ